MGNSHLATKIGLPGKRLSEPFEQDKQVVPGTKAGRMVTGRRGAGGAGGAGTVGASWM